MKKRIGGYLSGSGVVILTTMGCCLDSTAWRVVLAFVVISFVLIAVGVRMMNIPEALQEKGLRFESKEIKERKERNREATWQTWIAS